MLCFIVYWLYWFDVLIRGLMSFTFFALFSSYSLIWSQSDVIMELWVSPSVILRFCVVSIIELFEFWLVFFLKTGCLFENWFSSV